MRFRRKAAETGAETPAEASESAVEPAAGETAEAGRDETSTQPAERTGPFDATEDHGVDLDRTIDLGALRIAPLDDLDVRLQVDEATGQIASVLLADEEGAVELRAFAAPRSGGLWEEIRPGVVEEVQRLGGQAEEADGPHGTELRVVIPLKAPDGQQVVQPSRVFGIEGPRWLVRATMLGRPAVEIDADGRWWDALSRVVVMRGEGAMAPGDPLELTMPPGAFADDPEGLEEAQAEMREARSGSNGAES